MRLRQRMVPGCIVPCARSLEVFDRLERGRVNAAVIPIENSLAGSVSEHFDLLLARDVFVQKEFLLRIVHNLIAAPGVKPGTFAGRTVASRGARPVPRFFQNNPQIRPEPFYDTAGSVKHVSRKV